MKLFKNIDEKFEDIGFIKVEENEFCVVYERLNSNYQYIQTIAILRKKTGRHIVQSYDKELYDQKGIGNTCVGLTMYEMKLCIQKMKRKGWNRRANDENIL